MSRKIRWIKPPDGLRQAGQVEVNDDDLCDTWVKAGMAEYAEDDAKPHAVIVAEDEDERRKPVQAGEDKAVDEPPVNRSMKGKGIRR